MFVVGEAPAKRLRERLVPSRLLIDQQAIEHVARVEVIDPVQRAIFTVEPRAILSLVLHGVRKRTRGESLDRFIVRMFVGASKSGAGEGVGIVHLMAPDRNVADADGVAVLRPREVMADERAGAERDGEMLLVSGSLERIEERVGDVSGPDHRGDAFRQLEHAGLVVEVVSPGVSRVASAEVLRQPIQATPALP